MRKNRVKQGIQSIISNNSNPMKTNKSKQTNTSKLGLKEDEIRATFIVNQDNLNKLKALSWITRTPLKKIVDDAIKDYINDKKVKSLINKAFKLQKENNSFLNIQ